MSDSRGICCGIYSQPSDIWVCPKNLTETDHQTEEILGVPQDEPSQQQEPLLLTLHDSLTMWAIDKIPLSHPIMLVGLQTFLLWAITILEQLASITPY